MDPVWDVDNAKERRDSLFEEHLNLEDVLEKFTIRVEKHSEKITGVSQRLQQYYTFGQEQKSDKHEMYRKKLGTKKAEKDIALKRYEKACVMKLSRIDGRERAEDDEERANAEAQRLVENAEKQLALAKEQRIAVEEKRTLEKVKVDKADKTFKEQHMITVRFKKRKVKLEERGRRAFEASVREADEAKRLAKIEAEKKQQKAKEANMSTSIGISMEDLAKEQLKAEEARKEQERLEAEEAAREIREKEAAEEAEKLAIRRERMRKQQERDLEAQRDQDVAMLRKRAADKRAANKVGLERSVVVFFCCSNFLSMHF